jgi:hypothetical protein
MAVDNRNHVALSGRVREVRQEHRCESGGPALAEALGLLAAKWSNLRARHDDACIVIFELIELMGADPHRLLTGQGDRFKTIRETARARSVEEHPDPAARP